MKILLVTDVPPCKQYSGALLSEQIISSIPGNTVHCFVVINRDLANLRTSIELSEVTSEFIEKPRESAYRVLPGFVGDVSAFLFERIIVSRQLKTIKGLLIDCIKRENPDIAWCILQGQTMVRLAKYLQTKSNLPVLVQVWDHPIWWCRDNKLDPLTAKAFLKDYDEVLAKAEKIGASSHAMAQKYNEGNGTLAIPLIPGIDLELIYPPKTCVQSSSRCIIGIAGQLYANSEWEALLESLVTNKWLLNGKEVIIKYLGYYLAVGGHRPLNIEFLGYRSQKETVSELSKCDLLYCPYFFREDMKDIVSYSFPSKTITYLASGVPILFHGPSYSAPSKFFSENKASYICNELSPIKLYTELESVLSDNSRYADISETAHKVLLDNFIVSGQAEKIKQFFGIRN